MNFLTPKEHVVTVGHRRQKGWAHLHSRISDAIASFIKPIESSTVSNHAQTFERFRSPQKGEGGKDSPNHQQSGTAEKEPCPKETAQEQLPPEKALSEKRDLAARLSQQSSSLPLMKVLTTLRDSHKLLINLGRMIYARKRKDSAKGKLRKGVIVDIKT
jgi:hypothetical protein